MIMKNIIIKMLLLILGIILNGYNGFAQSYECGTEATKEIIEKSIAERKNRDNNRHKSSEILYVKVQPHIIRFTSGFGGLTDAQLSTAMQGLKNRYNSADIVFNICPAKYINNDTYHFQLVKNSSEFNAMYSNAATVADAVNIFFAENPTRSDGTGLNGWATFPSDYPSQNWVVVRNSTYSNGSTLAHEVGHYFNLFHTHSTSKGTENVTRNPKLIDNTPNPCWNCNTSGDTFCDTPADPNLSGEVSSSCSYSSLGVDGCSETYAPDATNIMSYSYRTCRRNFSASQRQELRDTRKYTRTYIANDCNSSPLPSCNDHTQNQGETGTDCGGPCPPCHCFDGVPNNGETGTDCGGTCPFTCTNDGPIYFDCEAGCHNNLILVCSAVSAEEYNGSIVVSNAQITNNVQIGFALVGSTGEIPLQVWVPSSDIIAEIAPNETVTIAPLLNTPDNLDGAYEVRVKIVGTDNRISLLWYSTLR